MKRYHLNKKEILYWASKARRFLKLPKINIEIEIINVLHGIRPSFNVDMETYLSSTTKIIFP